MIRRFLAAAAVAAVMLLGAGASPAYAFDLPGDWTPGDCNAPPAPTFPDLGAFMTGPPDYQPADPFTPHPTTTIFEQYGANQFTYHVYTGSEGGTCWMQEPQGTFWASMAGSLQAPLRGAYSATGVVAHYALQPDEWTAALDPLVTGMARAAHDVLWTPYQALAVTVLVAWIVLKAARVNVAHGARTALAAFGVFALVALAVQQPLWFARQGDGLISSGALTAAEYANGSTEYRAVRDPAAAVIGATTSDALYQWWCFGQVGASPTDPVGARYCPRLFKDQAMSWAEYRTYQRDPTGAGKALIKAKQRDWQAAAKEMKDQYPSNFDYMAGRHPDAYMTAVWWMWVHGAAALPFLLAAFLLIFAGYVMLRLQSVTIPGFGILALVPRMQHMILTPLRWAAAALFNVVIFFSLAMLDSRLITTVLDPSVDLPGLVKVAIVAVASFIMWRASRPFRSLTAMVRPSYDPARETAGSVDRARRQALNLVGTYLGARAGTAAGIRHSQPEPEPEEEGYVPPRREPAPYRMTSGDAADSAAYELPRFGTQEWVWESWQARPGAETGADVAAYDAPVHDGTRWEQMHPYAPTAPDPAAVTAALAGEARPLPAGEGRQHTTIYVDVTTGGATAVPDVTSRHPAVRADNAEGDEVYVIYRGGQFALSIDRE